MNIDTYRYLMSALIQVFGALVAVDSIFFLFRFEAIGKELRFIFKRLALYIYQLEAEKRGKRIIIHEGHEQYQQFLALSEHLKYISADKMKEKIRDSEEFLLKEKNKYEEEIKKINETYTKAKDNEREARLKRDLRNPQDNLKRISKEKELIRSAEIIFYKIISKKKKNLYLIGFSMSIAAFLSLSFTTALLFADCFLRANIHMTISIFSAVAALLGFFIIIMLALISLVDE